MSEEKSALSRPLVLARGRVLAAATMSGCYTRTGAELLAAGGVDCQRSFAP